MVFQPSRQSDLVKLAQRYADAAAARSHGLSLLVSKHGNANEAVWLRKSKLVGERAIDSLTVELTMPDWLARSEKLS